MTQPQIQENFWNDLHTGKIYYHHSAKRQGYISMKNRRIEKYCGRYGKGYILYIPYIYDTFPHKSKRYCTISYYIYA